MISTFILSPAHTVRALALGLVAITASACNGGNVSGGSSGNPDAGTSGTQPPASSAAPFAAAIRIAEPLHGLFINRGTDEMLVSGTIEGADAMREGTTVNVNGVNAPVDSDGSWQATVPMVPMEGSDGPLRSIVATITSADGVSRTDRIALMQGNSVPEGTLAPGANAISITSAGLDVIESAAPQVLPLDLSNAVPVGTVIADDPCGTRAPIVNNCIAIKATVSGPAQLNNNYQAQLAPQSDRVQMHTTISNMTVPLRLALSSNVPLIGQINDECNLSVKIATLQLQNYVRLEPMSGNRARIAVTQDGSVGVTTSGLSYTISGGGTVCNIASGMDLSSTMKELTDSGMEEFFNGPNKPLAKMLEDGLRNIRIADNVGPAIGAKLRGEFEAITERSSGVTLYSRTDYQPNCEAVEGAPQLDAVYAPEAAELGVPPSKTPVQGKNYHTLIASSPTGFNQLVKTLVECGMLVDKLETIVLDPNSPPTPLTTDVLSLLLGQVVTETYGEGTPVYLTIHPTMAPFVDGKPGKNGELTELTIPHLELTYIVNHPELGEHELLTMALDLRVGMNLVPQGQQLSFEVTPPTEENMVAFVTNNPLNANTEALLVLMPALMTGAFPMVTAGIPPFPVPPLAGLKVQPFEVSRVGDHIGIFATTKP